MRLTITDGATPSLAGRGGKAAGAGGGEKGLDIQKGIHSPFSIRKGIMPNYLAWGEMFLVSGGSSLLGGACLGLRQRAKGRFAIVSGPP